MKHKNNSLAAFQTLFEKNALKLRQLMAYAAGSGFWKKHFKNYDYTFNKHQFSWNTWQQIPILTNQDLLNQSFSLRVEDAESLINANIKKFILRPFFRGITQENILLLDPINRPEEHKDLQNLMVITQPRSLTLFHALLSILYSIPRRLLIISPDQLDKAGPDVFKKLSFTSLQIHPNRLRKFARFHNPKESNAIKKLLFPESVDITKHYSFIKDNFPGAGIEKHSTRNDAIPGLALCPYARAKYSAPAFHAKRKVFAELRNSDYTNRGEIVVTVTAPKEMAIIKYATGVRARAVFEKCSCKSGLTLIIDSGSKFVYSDSPQKYLPYD